MNGLDLHLTATNTTSLGATSMMDDPTLVHTLAPTRSGRAVYIRVNTHAVRVCMGVCARVHAPIDVPPTGRRPSIDSVDMSASSNVPVPARSCPNGSPRCALKLGTWCAPPALGRPRYGAPPRPNSSSDASDAARDRDRVVVTWSLQPDTW